MSNLLKRVLSVVIVLVMVLGMLPLTTLAAEETTAVFDFGANSTAAHVDGNDLGTSKSYTSGTYTLALTGMSKVYGPAYDAKGNSCIKMGTSSKTGAFSFVVPDEVTSVVIAAAKYKANTSKLSVNGTTYTLSGASNNGVYDTITVDTTATKTVTVATVSGGVRAMINSITFVIPATGDDTCEHANVTTTTVDATCSAAGSTTVVCDDCGGTVSTTVIPALEHTYENNVCSVCGAYEPDATLSLDVANTLGKSMAHNTYTDDKYYVVGKITEVYNTTYGNMYIIDEAGNELTIYGTYSADGATRYDKLTVKPIAGDTVKVYGIIGQYNGTAQMKNGWIVEHTPAECEHEWTDATCTEPSTCTKCGAVTGEALGHTYVVDLEAAEVTCEACDLCETILTVDEAGEVCSHYAQNTYSEEIYYVIGTVVAVGNTTYGNATLRNDENNAQLTTYGMYDVDGKRYDAMAEKPVAEDVVVLAGVLGNYNGAQIKNPTLLAIVTEPEEPVVTELNFQYRYGTNQLIQVNTNLPASTPLANFLASDNGCNIDQSANIYQQVGWIQMDNADGTIVLTFHFNSAFEAGQYYTLPAGAVFGFTDGSSYTLDNTYVFVWDGANWTVSDTIPEPECQHEYFYPCDPVCMICYELTNPDAAHNLIHVEAKAATCTENGNIEYWYCEYCGTCWDNAETTGMPLNRMMVVIPAAHTYTDNCDSDCDVCGEWRFDAPHNLTEHVEAVVPANCQETGHPEYWVCADCGAFFGSETDTSNQLNPAWITYTGEHVRPEGEPACAVVECELCGELDYGVACDRGDAPECQDAYCINCGEIVIGWGHSYAEGPLCQAGDCQYCGEHFEYIYEHENGAWAPCLEGECAYGCGLTYPATAEHTVEDPCAGGLCTTCYMVTVEPAHTIEHVAESCYNTEYWVCHACESYWADAELVIMTNSKNVIKAEPTHEAEHTAESCYNVEYWYCAACDTYFADADLKQITNSKNVIKAEPTHTLVHKEAVTGDCQTMGNIEHWYCEACGTVWTDAALTQISNHMSVKTGYGEHNFVDGVCSVCGEADPNAELIKWVGTQVQANSNLDMQFALKASDFEGTTGNYIVLTRTYADGTTDVVTINQADWTVSDNFYIVAYSGIAAKEMGDVIEAVVYNAEGKAISEVRAESIETYALSMLGKITNAEQKTMFVDLLNYGAEAQKFFGHNADKLVTAGLTEEQKGWATQSDVEVSDNRVKGDNFFGTNLSLENVVLMQFAFKVAPADGMYAEVTYTNYRGVAKTETLAIENNNGYAMVSVNSLAFADYETMVTCTLYNADGTVAGSATDSMASYAARANNELADALMKFCASAYAYFM